MARQGYARRWWQSSVASTPGERPDDRPAGPAARAVTDAADADAGARRSLLSAAWSRSRRRPVRRTDQAGDRRPVLGAVARAVATSRVEQRRDPRDRDAGPRRTETGRQRVGARWPDRDVPGRL